MKRFSDLLFLLVFLAALALVPLGTLLQERRTVSFWENRALAAPPPLTVEAAGADDYFDKLETVYSDHVFWRDGFMKLHTWLSLRLDRPVVSDQVVTPSVLLNFPGYSAWPTDYYPTLAQEAAVPLAQLDRQVTAYGGYFCYLGVPQQFSYFSHRYPSFMDSHEWSYAASHAAFSDAMSQAGVPYIDMLEVYDGLGRPADYYSAVDHHYTLPGALTAYETLIRHLNDNAGLSLRVYRPGDGLTLEELPNPYLGSKNRKLYGLWPTGERAAVAYPTEPIPFTRTDNGREVPAAVYDLPATDTEPVLYSLYMGGDQQETVIRTGRSQLPSILLVGESYTNAIESVLWCSFDETRSLDLRNYNLQSLQDYIAAYRPDVVVILRDDSTYLSALS